MANIALELLQEQPEVLKIHHIYQLIEAKQAHDDIESGNTIGKLLLRI